MDNATYEGINLTPINNDETYSRLRATETKIQPRYEPQRTEGNITDHRISKGVKQTNATGQSCNTKLNTVIIIMILILLLITLVSIALSVTTFNRLAIEQSRMLSQLENTNNDIKSALTSQFDTIQMNISQTVLELVEAQLDTAKTNISQTLNQNVLELVETQLNAAKINISQNLSQLDAKLELLLTQYPCAQIQASCGTGLWHRFAHLNMSDPSQQCPSAWREYNTSGARACGRPDNSQGNCVAVSYSIGQTYSRVCGRVIGYQYASPDAFTKFNHDNDINLDGVNITYGRQRSHIWSYVAGFSQLQSTSSQVRGKCPCSTDNVQGSVPPSSIGDRYYCESGNPNSGYTRILYSNDPLWDGQQCEGTCCTGTKSPPWFSIQLPAPTTEGIEVSICCDQRTWDEDVPVKLLEIYVQ